VNANPAILMMDFAERSHKPVVATSALAGAAIKDVVNVGRSATDKASEAGDPVVVSPLLFSLACGLGLDAGMGNPPLRASRRLALALERRLGPKG